jgi:hypothetical protein
MFYRFLADMVLVVHALIIAFVVVGLALILVGAVQHWHWIRNGWFRLAHVAAIAIVVVQSWFGAICPLTAWESRLREAAGDGGYTRSFIAHWLHEILFYDIPPEVFTMLYTAFGIAVLLAWRLVPPRRPWQ